MMKKGLIVFFTAILLCALFCSCEDVSTEYTCSTMENGEYVDYLLSFSGEQDVCLTRTVGDSSATYYGTYAFVEMNVYDLQFTYSLQGTDVPSDLRSITVTIDGSSFHIERNTPSFVTPPTPETKQATTEQISSSDPNEPTVVPVSSETPKGEPSSQSQEPSPSTNEPDPTPSEPSTPTLPSDPEPEPSNPSDEQPIPQEQTEPSTPPTPETPDDEQQGDPVDPTPSDPVDPDPVDPTPSDPVDPDPIDPTPSDPVDPDPVDPTPSDPVDPDPSDPTPSDPVDPDPVDPTPSDPVDPDPIDPTPSDPVDPTPEEPTSNVNGEYSQAISEDAEETDVYSRKTVTLQILVLSDETYSLKTRKITTKTYAIIATNDGGYLTIEFANNLKDTFQSPEECGYTKESARVFVKESTNKIERIELNRKDPGSTEQTGYYIEITTKDTPVSSGSIVQIEENNVITDTETFIIDTESNAFLSESE